MVKRRALGRGLDALLGEELRTNRAGQGLQELPVRQIHPSPFQPRQQPAGAQIEALSQSIRAQGLIQPVLVRPRPARDGGADMGADGQEPAYELVAGERRWRAAELAGLQQIPAVVRELSDPEAAAVALIENLQREDLNAIEAAQGFLRLHRDFQLSHTQIAAQIGQSRPFVSNMLRLLALDPEVQQRLRRGELNMGHGRALLSLDKPAQRRLAARVAEQGLSVRRTEQLVSKAPAGPEHSPSRHGDYAADPDLAALERTLSDRFAVRVRIQHNSRGTGILKIHYGSLNQLDHLLKKFK